MATIPEALGLAVEHQRAGRFQAAEEIYRAILDIDPNQVDALHMLGVLAGEIGNPEAAAKYIRRALELQPYQADFYNNLGEVLRASGRLADAADAYRRAVELNPEFALAHNNLGNALREQKKLDEAVLCYHQAIALQPDLALVHNNLGMALRAQHKLTAASACYREALRLQPRFAQAHNNLANALKEQGDLAEAIVCYERALELQPGNADILCNLAVALKQQGRREDAVTCYHRALQLRPDMAEAHLNLGHTLRELGELSEALASIRRALEIKPDSAYAHFNLGNILRDQGRLTEAIASWRRASELDPRSLDAHDWPLFTLHFCPEFDAKMIFEEHRRWNERYALPLAKEIQPHANERSPGRRLRVGYVSSNFNNHVVGRNLMPLFREHDHRQFEITCYANLDRPDHMTTRLQSYADNWRYIVDLSDEQLAQRIRGDGIDILVDLTLHMDGSRLLTFARKPAPVQVTFAGYPGTTGLSAIDYRLTDVYLDPVGQTGESERIYSEESIRLPHSFWCYDPGSSEPEVNSLPARKNGFLTFGCLNSYFKLNPYTLKLWAKILARLPEARLLLLAPEGDPRHEVLRLLEEENVEANRITFADRQGHSSYLKLYHQIDLGLDTLPYNGHTTSLDAAWMGVPTITMAGQTVVGRAGVSLLSNLKLTELIAHNPDEMVRIVLDLVGDLNRLSELRSGLRGRMRASPLMDPPGFARAIEAAYREMWGRWCGKAQ